MSFRVQHFHKMQLEEQWIIPKYPWASMDAISERQNLSKSIHSAHNMKNKNQEKDLYIERAEEDISNTTHQSLPNNERTFFESDERPIMRRSSAYSPDPDWERSKTNKGNTFQKKTRDKENKSTLQKSVNQSSVQYDRIDTHSGNTDDLENVSGYGPQDSTRDKTCWQNETPDRRIKTQNENIEDEVVEIETIHCTNCDKSFAAPTYKKICEALDNNGQPKCIKLYQNKRKIFSSAKV